MGDEVGIPEELKNVGEQEPEATPEPEKEPEKEPEGEQEGKPEGEPEGEGEGESGEGEGGEQESENMVPQSRFNEVHAQLKATQARLKALEDRGSEPPMPVESIIGTEIGGTKVKEVLGLTPEQSEKLDEWYEKDPISAQAWVNQKVSDVRRHYEYVARARNVHVRDLMRDHPDMYKKDEKGALVFDPESPKGKIFNDIAEKNPYLLNIPDGTKIAKLMLEERLGGKAMSKEKKVDEGGKKPEATPEPAKKVIKPISSKSKKPAKPSSNAPLSNEEKRVAAKFGISEEEYQKNKGVVQGAY